MPEKTKKMCVGCHDDFYNHTQQHGCWSFGNATIVKRVRVGIREPPPYSPNREQDYLSCYHAQGYAMLPLTDVRVREANK